MQEQTYPKRIKPMPVASHLVQFEKGKHKGKFGIFGLEGTQNSLRRFANIPIYISVRKLSENSGAAFDNKEEAEEYANKFNEFVKEMILTHDQIVK